LKLWKRCSSLIVCFILCFTMLNLNSNAADLKYSVGDIVDGTLLTNDNESIGTVQHTNRGTYYSDGISGIANYGNGLIYVSGTTNCNRTSSQIGLTLYVDRLESSGDWNCISQRSFSKNNSYYLDGSYDLTVAKGYFYRVRGYHTASSNGVYESGWSQTKAILIN